MFLIRPNHNEWPHPQFNHALTSVRVANKGTGSIHFLLLERDEAPPSPLPPPFFFTREWKVHDVTLFSYGRDLAESAWNGVCFPWSDYYALEPY